MSTPPPIKNTDVLRALIKQGLEFGEAVNVFAEFRTDEELRYVSLAREYARLELEIDDSAQVSIGDDNGAYVMAWVWVEDEEDET
jgi:hypothetical protein